jgi:hypothetical protein
LFDILKLKASIEKHLEACKFDLLFGISKLKASIENIWKLVGLICSVVENRSLCRLILLMINQQKI